MKREGNRKGNVMERCACSDCFVYQFGTDKELFSTLIDHLKLKEKTGITGETKIVLLFPIRSS